MKYIEAEYFNEDNLEIYQNKNNLFYYIIYNYDYMNFSLNIKTDWVLYHKYIDLENSLNKNLLSILKQIKLKFKEKFDIDIELENKVKWFNSKKIIKYNSKKFIKLSKNLVKEIEYLDYIKPNDKYQARYILNPVINHNDSKYFFVFKILRMEIRYKNSNVNSIIDNKEHMIINEKYINEITL
jgi:hypothetical protein